MIRTRNCIQPVRDAIRNHPCASCHYRIARERDADQYSDLISAFHLTNYCTVLLDTFEKIDLAIFSIDDPPSSWVVHDFKLIRLLLATAVQRVNRGEELSPIPSSRWRHG